MSYSKETMREYMRTYRKNNPSYRKSANKRAKIRYHERKKEKELLKNEEC